MRDAKRCWVEIDLDAVRHNAAAVREQVGPGVRLLAAVKANAYGHGMLEVAGALAGETTDFGVSSVAEARTLAASFPQARILLLAPALPHEREEIVRSGYFPCVSSLEEAAAYAACGLTGQIPVHLAIDTGMGRIGIWEEDARSIVKAIIELPSIKIDGIGDHLPVADEDEAFTSAQLARFAALIAELRQLNIGEPVVHCLNSAGIIRFPEEAHGMVRPGIMLYGSSPIPEFQSRLRPVMCLKTRVTVVRHMNAGRGISYGRTFITKGPMRVATLAAGYADGFPRHLSGSGAEVLIHGARCPLLGRVTMDQIVVDVSHLSGVVPGDEAVLLGKQGENEILANEMADKAGTISYEIFTGIGSRVERIYLREQADSVRP